MMRGAFILAGLLLLPAAMAARAEMVRVPAGTFAPFYTNDGPVAVAAFRLDEFPVTNREFLEFVTARPEWRRSNAPRLFVDQRYLQHWVSDLEPGALAPPESPVTAVSWFAARAFAAWRGQRLPTLAEWELAAAAEMSGDQEQLQRLLAWYARPTTLPLAPVGSTFRNAKGIWDLHGLAWEWVDDFNSFPVLSRDSADSDAGGGSFCGGGAIGVQDASDYAAFMRYAFRASLQARYCVASLGFRCAADGDQP